MAETGAYHITTKPQTTMFGKRTGSVLAQLESDYSSNVCSAAGPTATLAKAALINRLGRLASNDERAYVFCGDASHTVLVVSFAGDAWQYDIISADRVNRSGCIMGNCASFRVARELACEHAAQSFGGVLRVL